MDDNFLLDFFVCAFVYWNGWESPIIKTATLGKTIACKVCAGWFAARCELAAKWLSNGAISRRSRDATGFAATPPIVVAMRVFHIAFQGLYHTAMLELC